jgi:hypothetical protein
MEMKKGKLLTRVGEVVKEFDVPPLEWMPEIVSWHNVFVLREPFNQKPGNPAQPVYHQATMMELDLLTADWERRCGGWALAPEDRSPRGAAPQARIAAFQTRFRFAIRLPAASMTVAFVPVDAPPPMLDALLVPPAIWPSTSETLRHANR